MKTDRWQRKMSTKLAKEIKNKTQKTRQIQRMSATEPREDQRGSEEKKHTQT